MKKYLICIILLLLSFNVINAQTYYQKYKATSIVPTKDDSYIIVGAVTNKENMIDLWMTKLDKNGKIIWEKTYGGTGYDGATCIIPTDEGYMITGYSTSKDWIIDRSLFLTVSSWIGKINEKGEFIWHTSYGGDNIQTILPLQDKGYIVAGLKKNQSCIPWFFKINKEGFKVWEQTLNQFQDTRKVYISPTSDFGFIGTILNSYKIFVFKLDLNGTLVWIKDIGGQDYSVHYKIKQIQDLGYIMINGNSILKLDLSGNPLWRLGYGLYTYATTYHFDDYCITQDQQYLVIGSEWVDHKSISLGYGRYQGLEMYNIFIREIDSSGILKWEKFYKTGDNDRIIQIEQTINDGYVVLAEKQTSDLKTYVRIFSIDKQGTIIWDKILQNE